MEGRQFHVRVRTVLLILAVIFLTFTGVLYNLQVVHGADFLAQSSRKIADIETVEAARGEILDRYGRVLVSNRKSYQVTLDTSLMGGVPGRNQTVAQLLELCRQQGITWTDTLPISSAPPFVYTLEAAGPTARSRFSTMLQTMSADWRDGGDVARILDEIKQREAEQKAAEDRAAEEAARTETEQTGAAPDGGLEPIPTATPAPTMAPLQVFSAQDLFQQIRTYFELDESIPDTEARALVGVLYEIALRSKGVATSDYIFAEDVDIDFISAVKERGLKGVKTQTVTVRQYETPYAAHLLGRVGLMSPEEWQAYQSLGYAMNDSVGKDGAELAFESYLRGEAGRRSIERNTSGKVVSETWLEEPVPGKNVILTLDIRLQEALERSLAQHVPGLSSQVEGAAGVIIDVRSGGVLAMASYPTFDLSTYSTEFNTLREDPLKPLYNRATLGTFSPGSTFKMVVGVAGLEEGVITTTERILDTGRFQYPKDEKYPYGDYHPMCWIYRQYRGTHKLEDLTHALKDSCNIYFYTVADRLAGIDLGLVNQYARMFGLGEKTGIELPENVGVLDSREYSESIGQPWYLGNILPAAIGQGNTRCTPLQIANYVATLVNGGDHYAAHLLKSVKSSDFSQVIEEYSQQPLDTLNLEQSYLDAIKEGMRLVATEGAGVSNYFKDLDITLGAKTGSAQVAANSETNAVFVCFAPFDNPEIAIALVAEKAGSGGGMAAVATDILTAYFSGENTIESVGTENTLLQ